MNLLSPVQSIFKSLKGRQHKKFLKKCAPLVNKINKIEKEYQSLSTEQLQAKTQEFIDRFENNSARTTSKEHSNAVAYIYKNYIVV